MVLPCYLSLTLHFCFSPTADGLKPPETLVRLLAEAQQTAWALGLFQLSRSGTRGCCLKMEPCVKLRQQNGVLGVFGALAGLNIVCHVPDWSWVAEPSTIVHIWDSGCQATMRWHWKMRPFRDLRRVSQRKSNMLLLPAAAVNVQFAWQDSDEFSICELTVLEPKKLKELRLSTVQIHRRSSRNGHLLQPRRAMHCAMLRFWSSPCLEMPLKVSRLNGRSHCFYPA